jgi:tyrosyl-DNA phosphodiesterase-1
MLVAYESRAMKASMSQDVSRPETPEVSRSIATPLAPAPVIAPITETKPTSVLGNRAQMEAERIARQKAREGQNGSSQPSSSAVTATKAPASSSGPKIATMSDLHSRNAEAGPSSSNRQINTVNTSSKPYKSTHHPLQSRGPFPTDAAGEYYLDGEMRHNALTIGNPSEAPTFTPHQVVGKVRELASLESSDSRE